MLQKFKKSANPIIYSCCFLTFLLLLAKLATFQQ
jgi:hypothetical protein